MLGLEGADGRFEQQFLSRRVEDGLYGKCGHGKYGRGKYGHGKYGHGKYGHVSMAMVNAACTVEISMRKYKSSYRGDN